MYYRFSVGGLVRNIKTNEDARVLRIYTEDNTAMYEVAVPRDSTTWEMGTDRVTQWADSDLEESKNQLLRQ